METEPEGEDRIERIVQRLVEKLATEIVNDVFSEAERAELLKLGSGVTTSLENEPGGPPPDSAESTP